VHSPLKVVQQAPSQVSPDIHAILVDRLLQSLQVRLEVLDTVRILEGLLSRETVLVEDSEAILGHA